MYCGAYTPVYEPSVDICRENEMISHVCTVITRQAVLILYSVTKCYQSRREIKICSYQSRRSYVEGGFGSLDSDKDSCDCFGVLGNSLGVKLC